MSARTLCWNWFLVEIACNLLIELLDDMDTKNVDEVHIGDVIASAIDYLGEALE